MKKEEIKKLLDQFEAVANIVEGMNVGVPGSCNLCWVMQNGITLSIM